MDDRKVKFSDRSIKQLLFIIVNLLFLNSYFLFSSTIKIDDI